MRLVITGLPRSGTLYTAKLLAASGLLATHEAIFSDRGYRRQLEAICDIDVSWMAAGFNLSSFRRIRLLRHPYFVLRSLVAFEIHDRMVFLDSVPRWGLPLIRCGLPDMGIFSVPRWVRWARAASFMHRWDAMCKSHEYDLSIAVERLDRKGVGMIANLLDQGLEDARVALALDTVPVGTNHRCDVPSIPEGWSFGFEEMVSDWENAV